MPRVFVVNRGGHDFSPAKEYGELYFLSEGSMNKYATAKIYRQFASLLRESGPDDFIVITGLTVMVAIACASFAYLHGGRLNLLIFKDGRYVERKMLLSELLATGKSDTPSEEDQIKAMMEE